MLNQLWAFRVAGEVQKKQKGTWHVFAYPQPSTADPGGAASTTIVHREVSPTLPATIREKPAYETTRDWGNGLDRADPRNATPPRLNSTNDATKRENSLAHQQSPIDTLANLKTSTASELISLDFQTVADSIQEHDPALARAIRRTGRKSLTTENSRSDSKTILEHPNYADETPEIVAQNLCSLFDRSNYWVSGLSQARNQPSSSWPEEVRLCNLELELPEFAIPENTRIRVYAPAGEVYVCAADGNSRGNEVKQFGASPADHQSQDLVACLIDVVAGSDRVAAASARRILDQFGSEIGPDVRKSWRDALAELSSKEPASNSDRQALLDFVAAGLNGEMVDVPACLSLADTIASDAIAEAVIMATAGAGVGNSNALVKALIERAQHDPSDQDFRSGNRIPDWLRLIVLDGQSIEIATRSELKRLAESKLQASTKNLANVLEKFLKNCSNEANAGALLMAFERPETKDKIVRARPVFTKVAEKLAQKAIESAAPEGLDFFHGRKIFRSPVTVKDELFRFITGGDWSDEQLSETCVQVVLHRFLDENDGEATSRRAFGSLENFGRSEEMTFGERMNAAAHQRKWKSELSSARLWRQVLLAVSSGNTTVP